MNTEKTNHELNVLVAKACHMEWEGRKLYIKERGRRSRWCIRYGPSDNHCWLFNPAESIIIALELALHHMPEGWWMDFGLKDPGHKIILKRSPISREDPGCEKWLPVNTLEEMARTIIELWLEAMEAKTKSYTKCVRLDSEKNMTPEEAKLIKCDRCGVICGLHRHETGWRCGLCVWYERRNLITCVKQLLSSVKYGTTSDNPKKVAIVSLGSITALEAIVEYVTS